MHIAVQYGGNPETLVGMEPRKADANLKDDCWIGTNSCADRAVLEAWVSHGQFCCFTGKMAGQSRFQEADKKTKTGAPTRLAQEHGHHSIE
jgi:hypothetical protein